MKTIEVYKGTYIQIADDQDANEAREIWIKKHRERKFSISDDLLERERGFVRDAKMFNLRNRNKS